MSSFDPEALIRPNAIKVFNREAFGDRVYGVTGAGQRIGESIARSLAELGARLVLVDINEAGVQGVAASLRDVGADVHAVVGDVSEPGTSERAVDTAMQAWGRVDGWVSNAVINPRAALADQADADVEYAWRVNVEAARYAVRGLMPIMKVQGHGVIVNVGSILAHQTRAWDATYAGTKGAIESLTRAWALELAGFGIRVCGVRPGAVERNSDLISDFGGGEIGALRRRMYELHVRTAQPRQVPTMPRDVANAVIFLLSDAAAALTGVMLPVDGGTSIEFGQVNDDSERLRAERELHELRARLAELEAQSNEAAEAGE